MRLEKAKEMLSGLDATQKTRLNRYCKTLSTDRDVQLFDNQVYDALVQLGCPDNRLRGVVDYLNKIGFAQSIYEYSKIKNALDEFKKTNHTNFSWNNNFKTAKQALLNEVKQWRLQMIQYQGNVDIEEIIPRKDTHAGFAYVETGKRKKGEYLEDIYLNYSKEEDKAKHVGSFNKPILIGSRTQASGAFEKDGLFTDTFKSKSRLVSMIDIYQILAESKFARSFQYKMGTTSWYAGGKDDASVLGRISSLRDRYSHSITIDYSHYDQSISDWLIREAFDIVREAFCAASVFDERLFSIVREDFINKVFIDGEGKLLEVHKGVPSGSMFTQIIDSVVNRLMIDTYMLSKGIKDYEMMIMGDDNIIFSKQQILTDELASYLVHNFGVEVNSEKCSTALSCENPEFLSRIWRYDGVYREPNMLISKLLYPEKFRNYRDGADPYIIIYSYYLAFPRGMDYLIDEDKLRVYLASRVHDLDSSIKYLSGYMQFRLQYR